MARIISLYTNSYEYNKLAAAKQSMTVAEFIEYLASNYSDEDILVFCNDGGYTYGYVNENFIQKP